ncbi:MAG TPA: DUF3467 domain-containing protein [Steroidobacteraceae bacterium]|jgi:hypothetical protein|nr:DUF3467 domain-containing protein [Steroidobacteraceae bacterium]
MNKEAPKTNVTPTAAPPSQAQPPQAQQQMARVSTTNLKTSYCNMCSTNTTREEVVLNFGVNQNWDRPESPEVSLEHRIILSPFLAKRLSQLLNKVVEDYETRHSALG